MSKLQPTVQFDYPTEPFGQIPAFQDIEEEAEFWDTHEVTDHNPDGWSVQPIAQAELDEWLTFRLVADEREALAQQARERGMDTSALVTVWLKDRLRQELEKKAS